jgi:hypothetical protein
MTNRWKLRVTATVATCTIIAGCAGAHSAFAQSTKRMAGAPANVSATPTKIPVKPIVHNPTPIAGYLKHINLPKPIVLEVGTKTEGVGLSQTKALFLANSYVPQMYIVAPTYVPKNYALQLIHVDPAQDQQTPPAMYLQYVPKGLKSARGTYPSFYVNKQVGNSTVIYPGAKPQVVTINRGKKGIGVVKGTLVDLKPKNGYETVHILWTRVTISYDLSSNIGVSKLSIKDLLAVAATVQ